MSPLATASAFPSSGTQQRPAPGFALSAAVLAFFVIALDTPVVSVVGHRRHGGRRCRPRGGGALHLSSWRMIFVINLPGGLTALMLPALVTHSPRRQVLFDWIWQIATVLATGALAFGVLQAGASDLGEPRVLVSLEVAVLALAVFVVAQTRGKHGSDVLSSTLRRVSL